MGLWLGVQGFRVWAFGFQDSSFYAGGFGSDGLGLGV